MQCKQFDECGRDVYYDPTGLCLKHEKERRARPNATPAKKKTTATRPRKPRTPKTANTEAVTEARADGADEEGDR